MALATEAIFYIPSIEVVSPSNLPSPEKIPQDMKEHARIIWHSIEAFFNPITLLPADYLSLETPDHDPAPITSPTNIGLTLLSVIAAKELGLIDETSAHAQVATLAKTLTHLNYPNNLPVNWYDTSTAKPIKNWPATDDPYPLKLSSVDTAWYAAGLYGASQAFPDIPELADILKSIDLGKFYNHDTGLCAGELSLTGEQSEWNYGAISEARVISYLGVALGQIPTEHLSHLWQSAKKIQEERYPDWSTHHPGTVPTWGGSVFERAMLLLIFDETRLSPEVWPKTHHDCIDTQIRYACPNTGLWGYSPASAPTKEADYQEYSVPELGLWTQGRSLGIDTGSEIQRVITPHAIYLALTINPQVALQAINRLSETFPDSWSSFGFPDSINTSTGSTSKRLLVLDQCMGFLALAQHIKPDCVRQYFKSLEDKLIPLMSGWNIDIKN